MKKVMRNSMFLFGVIIILSGCGMQEKQTEQKSEQKENTVNLESLMGGEDDNVKETLDASEIKTYDENSKMKEMISDILAQKGKYAKAYKDMCQDIEFELGERGKEGESYYISDIPVLWWDAVENRIDEHYAKLAVFSEKHEILGTLDVNTDFDGELFFSFFAGDDSFFKEMKKTPEDKYVFIMNASKLLMLAESNKIILPKYNPKVKTRGDYYHALPYQTLAVSYHDLADEKHLMKQSSASDRKKITDKKTRQMKESKSSSQYEKLMDSFEKTETDELIYPDYYGGSYIDDDGGFVVCVVAANAEEKKSVSKSIEETINAKDFKIRNVKHSYHELEEMMELLNKYKQNTRDSEIAKNWSGHFLSESDNAIFVQLDDASDEQISLFQKEVTASPMIRFMKGGRGIDL